jgi:hypothetical protein
VIVLRLFLELGKLLGWVSSCCFFGGGFAVIDCIEIHWLVIGRVPPGKHDLCKR